MVSGGLTQLIDRNQSHPVPAESPETSPTMPKMNPLASLALREIVRQPDALLGLIGRREELRALARSVGASRRPERLYAFGCGDGFFAAGAATPAFIAAGLYGYLGVSALEFVQCHARSTDSSCLLLPISMSGNVDRTVAGLDAGQAHGAVALAITNSTSGLLAQSSKLSFNLDIVEPKGFMAGTVTYTSSLVALFLFAAECGFAAKEELHGPPIEALADDIRAIGDTLGDVRAQITKLVSDLPGAQRVYFLGGGSGFASARYAAAKFVELTATHAVPQDTEEFAHSSFWQFQKADLVFVLHEPNEPEGISGRTAALLREFGARVVEILPGDPGQEEPDRIRIVNSHACWSPLALSIPLQLIAYYWSLRDGLDPDTRGHLRDDELRFRISRQLSRRTLVRSDGAGH
jgi:fructoselysine-6-P-deglycase FrlB-like protein